jgi:hypothetical protein
LQGQANSNYQKRKFQTKIPPKREVYKYMRIYLYSTVSIRGFYAGFLKVAKNGGQRTEDSPPDGEVSPKADVQRTADRG